MLYESTYVEVLKLYDNAKTLYISILKYVDWKAI